MKFYTEYGEVNVADGVFAALAGWAAARCFGVKGLVAHSMTDELAGVLGRKRAARGVKISYFPAKGEIGVVLRLAVEHGVNIPAITRSIMAEVRYVLEKCTGVRVGPMSVFIDALKPDGRRFPSREEGS